MNRVIIDTNFAMIPAQFKVDIFSEIDRIMPAKYKICILDKSIDELKKIIKEQKGKHKTNASLALQLLKAKKVNIIKTKQGYADDILVEIAKKSDYIATQDLLLRKRLKGKCNLIIMRQKKFLIIL